MKAIVATKYGPPDVLQLKDVHSYDVVPERLSEQGFRCIVPFLRGYGPTTFKSPDILRSGQQSAKLSLIGTLWTAPPQ